MRKEEYSETTDEKCSTVVFYFDKEGDGHSYTEFLNRKDRLALLQFMRIEIVRMERDLAEEMYGKA